MRTRLNLFLCFIIVFLSGVQVAGAAGGPKVKPGTWEMEISMEGLPMALPPKKTTYCVTKSDYVPPTRQEKDCKLKWNHSGNTVNWTMNCKDSGATGKAKIVYKWDKMSGDQEINMGKKGNNMVVKSTMKGKWISAKCARKK